MQPQHCSSAPPGLALQAAVRATTPAAARIAAAAVGRASDRQIRASRIDAEARTPYIDTTQGSLTQLGHSTSGWAHSRGGGRERLGSTGFDLGALVGGFLDVHAIIRLEGAASSWYPVYDRVLPGCAERLSSAAAPLGAALHSPIDRTRARIRRSALWRRLAAVVRAQCGAGGGRSRCSTAAGVWGGRAGDDRRSRRAAAIRAGRRREAAAEHAPRRRRVVRRGARRHPARTCCTSHHRRARLPSHAGDHARPEGFAAAALTPGPFSRYALARYTRRAALALLQVGSRVRTQISLGRTAVIVSDVWSLYWCHRRSHHS
jgi:hypothetical protein